MYTTVCIYIQRDVQLEADIQCISIYIYICMCSVLLRKNEQDFIGMRFMVRNKTNQANREGNESLTCWFAQLYFGKWEIYPAPLLSEQLGVADPPEYFLCYIEMSRHIEDMLTC